MKLYTIRNLESWLQKHQNYSSIVSKHYKRLFIDKCNWFITHIIKNQIKSEKGLGELVNIHSKTLKESIGNKYNSIINALVDIEIVYINEKYSSGKFTKSYALKKNLNEGDYKMVEVSSKAFRNKLKEFNARLAKESESNPILDKINRNTLKIQLTNNPAAYLLDFPLKHSPLKHGTLVWRDDNIQQRLNKYEAYFKAFRTLNKTNNLNELYELPIFFQPIINQIGRVYHIGASMPRLIRKICVTKSDELIYEVDMASAQPSLLILEWIRSLGSMSEEANKCLELVTNGNVYKHLENNSEVLRDMNYGKMKKGILTTFNGEYKPTKLYKELKALLPELIKWIDNIKFNEGYKKVSHRGQSAEAKVFVEVYKNLPEDMFALLIHDCILTTENKTQMVKDRLIKRVRELYKDVIPKDLNIDKLFKTNKVSVVRWVDYRSVSD